MTRYEVISKDYISNCLIEVIKAKMRNPQVKIYFCRPRITENGNFQSLHFMWEDENGSYDFSEPEAAGLPPWKQFLFKGHIRKFKKGFAEKYAAYRNGIKQVDGFEFSIKNIEFYGYVDTEKNKVYIIDPKTGRSVYDLPVFDDYRGINAIKYTVIRNFTHS